MEPPKDISQSVLFQNCFLLKLPVQLVSAESGSLIKANEKIYSKCKSFGELKTLKYWPYVCCFKLRWTYMAHTKD